MFCFVVPTPDVTITALNNQIVGSALSLICNVTTVRGIHSSVDIVWTKDDKIIEQNNAVMNQSIYNGTLMLHTSIYNISVLEMTDDNSTYQCQGVINTNPSVKNSNNYTLNITGKPAVLSRSTYTYSTQ